MYETDDLDAKNMVDLTQRDLQRFIEYVAGLGTTQAKQYKITPGMGNALWQATRPTLNRIQDALAATDMLLPADVFITPGSFLDSQDQCIYPSLGVKSRDYILSRRDRRANSIPLASPGRTGPRILEQPILKSSPDATSRGRAREAQTTDWPSELGAPCNDRREQGESRLFRDLHQNNKPFGGVTFIFFGDWRQNLPGIVKGTWPRQ